MLLDYAVFRVLLIVIAVVALIWFCLPLTIGIVNIGNAFGIACSVLLLSITIFYKKIFAVLHKLYSFRSGKITMWILGVIILLGVSYCLIISIMMLHSAYRKPDTTPQAVIVLGCKVRGVTPSLMLSKRIRAAYDAMQTYPDMVAIVSGGKGSDEEISEAECMRRELVKMGIDESRIYMEDQSTSTSENLRFSKKILDEQGITGDLLLATDAYHQMRAQYLAKHENLPHCDPASAPTSAAMFPTYWVREWFGLAHAFVFGN